MRPARARPPPPDVPGVDTGCGCTSTRPPGWRRPRRPAARRLDGEAERAARAGAAAPRRRPPCGRSGSSPRPPPSLACRCSTSTSCTNASADRLRELQRERDHAEHVDAELLDQLGLARRPRSARPGASRAAPPRTGAGRRSRTTEARPSSRARFTVWPMICWCPRWTPSKTPIVTTDRPHPAGAALTPRQRCTSHPPPATSAGVSTTSGRARPSRSDTTATTWPSGANTAYGPGDARTARSGPPCESTRACASSTSRRSKHARRGLGQRQGHRVRPARASCSRVAASASVNPPTAVRRSAVRCPPTPSAAPEVAGDGPDVGAGRAVDVDVHIEHGLAGVLADADVADVEPLDGDPAGGQLDLLAPADPRVGAHAVHLDGADRAGHLVDLADERASAAARTAASSVTAAAGVRAVTSPSASSVTVAYPEPDGRGVALARADDVGQQAGGPLDPDHQHPGRHRVEGAAVPDPAGAGQPPDRGRPRRATSSRPACRPPPARPAPSPPFGRPSAWQTALSARRRPRPTGGPAPAAPGRPAGPRRTRSAPAHTPPRPEVEGVAQPDARQEEAERGHQREVAHEAARRRRR